MKENNVKIDCELLRKAKIKALGANLPNSFNGLVNYLLYRVHHGDIALNFNPESFTWSYMNAKNTYIRYNEEMMILLKNKIENKGLKATNNFTINFLLTNFLKN